MICQHGARRALCIQCHPPVDRPTLGREDVTVTVAPGGVLEVTAMVDGHRERRRYMGYPGRRAVRMFLDEINEGRA
jgi:hypothetical protein